MFNLVYRDGAPENAGHYEIFDTNGTTEFEVGTLVSVFNGEAVPYVSGKPYGVVAIGSKDEGSGRIGDQISVLKITEDMIFRCKFDVGDPGKILIISNLQPITFDSEKPLGESVTAGYAFGVSAVVSEGVHTEQNRFEDVIVEGRFVYVPET